LHSRRPKLLAVDLDGTLLDASGQPHARDVRAIHRAIEHGVHVSIVTGRLYSGTRAFIDTLGLRGAVACADGSHLVLASNHATLVHLGVRGAAAISLRDALARAGTATFVFAKDAIAYDGAGTPFLEYVATWSNEVRVTDSIYEHDFWSADDGLTAVVALGTRAQIIAAVEDIARDLPDEVLVAMFPVKRLAGTWAIIVRSSGSTKGTAMRWIADYTRVPLGDTVCVGDWINDVPMFEVAGRSFAMGHAPAEVKAKATDVLDETVEVGGGVARVVEKVFQIRVK
jgi:hydroxymethylpyrimidine pyrophosphatase-like HAD family hydrolase